MAMSMVLGPKPSDAMPSSAIIFPFLAAGVRYSAGWAASCSIVPKPLRPLFEIIIKSGAALIMDSVPTGFQP